MLGFISLLNSVFPFMVGILETVWDKHSVTAATPPPSPTSGESGDLLSNLLQSPSSAKLLNQPIPILDVESEYICSLALLSVSLAEFLLPC